MDLLYRLNLQRRGSMKSIMQSSQGKRAEIGFDTNWDFLESQLYFEEQTQITKVNFIGSQRCKIVPKSLLLMENGDLQVSSYSPCGIKTRAYRTSPFQKISKHENSSFNSEAQSKFPINQHWLIILQTLRRNLQKSTASKSSSTYGSNTTASISTKGPQRHQKYRWSRMKVKSKSRIRSSN